MSLPARSTEPFGFEDGFDSIRNIRTPRLARWFARGLLVLFLLFPFLLMFVPWQQTVQGRGQIVAFAPTERKQVVKALVGGQIKKWHVVEGSRVKAGDPIVDIDDNDPDLAGRLNAQRDFLLSRRKAAEEEIAEQGRAVTALESALDASVKAAKANRDAAGMMVDVAKQSRKNSEFALGFEKTRFEMYERLYKDTTLGGLESKLNRDEAQMRSDRASTDVTRAEAEVKRVEAALIGSESQVFQAEAAGLTALATARRDHRRAEQNLFSIDREIQDLDNRIERFKARYVKAPCDGSVFRILANVGQGGQYVKEGDELAVIVPDTADRVVELSIDGVDAPLIAAHMERTGQGPHVRLQFEGWPAIQFTGWPSVATGTFGGRVRQIDSADDGYGRFRILVEPDVLGPGDEWPEGLFLRQGNQAVGWVFLNRVTLGYELWRQFNGFPPVVAPLPPDSAKEKSEKKPLKVKPA